MKTRVLLFLMSFLAIGFVANAQVQQDPATLEAEKAKKQDEIKALQADIDKIDGLLSRLDVTGWNFGGSGAATFSANGNSNWVALGTQVNTINGDTVTGLAGLNTAINVDLYGNYLSEKFFWYNGLNVQQTFNTVLSDGLLSGNTTLGDVLNRTSDKLYFQSVPGYRINSELAASGLFDLNSSMSQFLNPATVSGGLGVTWTPTKFMDGKLKPLRVIFHPLTWRGTIVNVTEEFLSDGTLNPDYRGDLRNNLGLSGDETLISDFGLKFIADYARGIKILGNNIAWTTRLRGFAPYTQQTSILGLDADGNPQFADPTGPMELDWENAFSVLVFKNISVGANWNLRNYKPEFDGWQHIWNAGFGLSTTF